MSWNKYSIEDRKIPGISLFAFVLIIVSLYAGSKLILYLACFFLCIVCLNQFYLKNAGMGLYFENKLERKHHFIGETGKWTLIFRNEGYPILNGELRIYYDEYVKPHEENHEPNQGMYEIILPFSLLVNQTKQINLPYMSDRRGIAKIRKLELHIPSLIGFGGSVLVFKDIIKQEAVVYPSPIPVKGLKEQISSLLGENTVPYSVYEDRLGPLGTRDYVSTDSFNRIHWKASARKQTLQTKVYEKISEKGWNISVNLADGYAITAHLEQILSSITEFSYYAVRNQIPYSICINVRTAGSMPFYYIPKGEGKEHLQKVLETLSSINKNSSIFPYQKMLSFYQRHLSRQPYFLHAGNRNQDIDSILFHLAGSGVYLTELTVTEDHGLLNNLEIRHEKRRLV